MMDINTYGELKKMLPATGNGKVPGIRQLREKAKVLLVKETTTGRIEIFDNGFFTFEECGCTTVFGVDRCERPELYHVEGNVTLDFSSYPWDLILESAASSRLEHNANYREDYRMEIPLDASDWSNNLAFSVKPEHEIQEEEELYVEWRKMKNRKMKKILSELTEKQLQILVMYRVKKMTQAQIAEKTGLSRRSIRCLLERAEKNIKKYSAK